MKKVFYFEFHALSDHQKTVVSKSGLMLYME